MNAAPETRIRDRARNLYRDVGPKVDTATAARLRAARRKALETSLSGTRHHLRWMVPTGACAAVALAVLSVWQPLRRPSPMAVTAPVAATQALPPDAEQTDPTLYQNLDFYAWLADQPATGHHANGH